MARFVSMILVQREYISRKSWGKKTNCSSIKSASVIRDTDTIRDLAKRSCCSRNDFWISRNQTLKATLQSRNQFIGNVLMSFVRIHATEEDVATWYAKEQ